MLTNLRQRSLRRKVLESSGSPRLFCNRGHLEWVSGELLFGGRRKGRYEDSETIREIIKKTTKEKTSSVSPSYLNPETTIANEEKDISVVFTLVLCIDTPNPTE